MLGVGECSKLFFHPEFYGLFRQFTQVPAFHVERGRVFQSDAVFGRVCWAGLYAGRHAELCTAVRLIGSGVH